MEKKFEKLCRRPSWPRALYPLFSTVLETPCRYAADIAYGDRGGTTAPVGRVHTAVTRVTPCHGYIYARHVVRLLL